MDNLILIEEEEFLTLMNHYCLWETLDKLNPDLKLKVNFDQETYENIRKDFLDDYINIPIDLSNETIEKLEKNFRKEGVKLC